MERKTIRLLDVTVDSLTTDEAMKRADHFLGESRLHHIVTPGAEFLLEATAHRRFRDILNRADMSLPDGFSLHIGARLTGQKLQQRIPGADFTLALMKVAARRNARVFLFGGQEMIAERAAQHLLRLFPELIIVGIESGSRGHWTKLQDQRIIERIHLAKPDILLVALGAPKQELWIDRHRTALHDVKIAIGVGRTLDYFAGAVKRAPKIMRDYGFEWLHTFLNAGQYHQPRYRRQRVINATYRFVIEVIKHRHVSRA